MREGANYLGDDIAQAREAAALARKAVRHRDPRLSRAVRRAAGKRGAK